MERCKCFSNPACMIGRVKVGCIRNDKIALPWLGLVIAVVLCSKSCEDYQVFREMDKISLGSLVEW